jgi:hypothetical protein
VIGGNGSQAGALALWRKGLPVVGIASTIDNDLVGSDVTIGATTALDMVLGAIDRLRVTASSHQRAFVVETMGRDCGYLALIAGIAGGAEAIVIPAAEMTPAEIAEELRESYRRARVTPSSWSRKVRTTMPMRSPATSMSMQSDLGSSCASRGSGTSSAGDRPECSIACWPPASARVPSIMPRREPAAC